jgi:DNA-binding transcriptional ArsR family regulator
MDPRVAKAISHPLRLRLLSMLNQGVASPSDLARELDEPLGNVSYHVKKLEELGCIELVRTSMRRGAVEHHYRALERPVLTEEDLLEIPLPVRRQLADSILGQIAKDVTSAARAGGFEREDVHVTDAALTLDEEGWKKLGELTAELSGRALEVQAQTFDRVAERRASDPEEGGDTFPANLSLLLFEQPKKR